MDTTLSIVGVYVAVCRSVFLRETGSLDSNHDRVTLTEQLNPTESQFSPLYNGDENCSHLTGL